MQPNHESLFLGKNQLLLDDDLRYFVQPTQKKREIQKNILKVSTPICTYKPKSTLIPQVLKSSYIEYEVIIC